MHPSFWNASQWTAMAVIGQIIAALSAAWAAWAAQRSANLAQRSVEVMDASMRNGDRAYVAMVQMSVAFESNDKPPVFLTELSNAGKTPAHEVRLGFHAVFVNNPEDAKNFTIHFDDGARSIAPSVSIRALGQLPEKLSPEELNALVSERAFLIGLGVAVYRDIFGKEHKTGWGVQYKQGAPGHFIFTSFHNFMD